MKKSIYLAILCVFLGLTGIAQTQTSETVSGEELINSSVNTEVSLRSSGIDPNDSIFFDFSNATQNSNLFTFPVFFDSDEAIYSVDFSLKFNQNELSFDSLTNLYTSLNGLANYNTSDSTLRVTTFSIPQLPNDSNIMWVKFEVPGPVQIDSSDFTVVRALLNGDACSYRIIPAISIGIAENAKNHQIEMYPNPTHDLLNVFVPAQSELSIYDLRGKMVMEIVNVETGYQSIPVDELPGGTYILVLGNSNFRSTASFVVEN